MTPHQLNALLGETLLAILAVALVGTVTIRSPRIVSAVDAGNFRPPLTALLSALLVWLLLKEGAIHSWTCDRQWSSTPLHGSQALTYAACAIVAAFRPLVTIAAGLLCIGLIATAARRLSTPHGPAWGAITTWQVLRRRWTIARHERHLARLQQAAMLTAGHRSGTITWERQESPTTATTWFTLTPSDTVTIEQALPHNDPLIYAIDLTPDDPHPGTLTVRVDWNLTTIDAPSRHRCAEPIGRRDFGPLTARTLARRMLTALDHPLPRLTIDTTPTAANQAL
jgi:hypothetical protein